jgi:ketosteroid isomerase-like protein
MISGLIAAAEAHEAVPCPENAASRAARSALASNVDDTTTIAIRGERLALLHVDDVRDTRLAIAQLDEYDNLAPITYLPGDDLAGAFTELDDRFSPSLGAGQAVFALARESLAAYNAGDFERSLAMMTRDALNVDNRPLGWGTADAHGLRERVRELRAMVPDVAGYCTVVHRCTPHGLAARVRQAGTSVDGAPYEVVWEIVGIVRGGRIAHSEYFPVGRVDEALRRLDELSAEGGLELRSDGL